MTEQNGERLQKALSRAGIASRRGGEELIMAGRVKVNGKIVTELGTKINPATDKVTVDDEPVAVKISAAPQKVYIMLNKPAGYLSTVTDPQGRPTIMDLLDSARVGRLYPVGRLDADTEGLLLLTNDGAFANALSHPRFGVEKEYVALVDGIIAMKDIDRLRKGVAIPVEDNDTGEHVSHMTKPAKVDLVRHEGSNSLVRFILKEGKKRQIRLMAEAVDHPVIELRRVRQGPVKLGDLTSGKFRNLTKQEVKDLLDASKPGAFPEEETTPVQPGRERGPAPSAPTVRPPFGGGAGRPTSGRGGTGRPSFGGGADRPSFGGGRTGERSTERSGERPAARSFDRANERPTERPGEGRDRPSPRRGADRPPDRQAENQGRRTGRPLEPFRTPGESRGGPRRFGERRFDDEGTRRGPSPDRGPRPGPARFDRDRDDASSGRPPAPFRRGPSRSDAGNAPDFERGRERTGSNFERGRDRTESNFERSGPGSRSSRPDNDRPDRDRPDRDRSDRGGEGRAPFRGGPNRQGPGRDRDTEVPTPYRGGKPTGGGGRFSPSRSSGGAPAPSYRPGRPNPNGFVPAAERSAPTPGRQRPPRSAQSGPETPGRGGGGPPRNRPTGQRPSGPGRPGRRD